MIHARKDYNESVQDSTGRIPENEPVFLLRGQDIFAPGFVRAYAELYLAGGGNQEVYDGLIEHACKMDDWQAEVKKKFPTISPDQMIENYPSS